MQHAADVITVLIVFVVALLKGVLWLWPWRAEELRLRLSLSFYSFTFAALWGVAFFRIVGVMSMPAPQWFNWTIRVLLTVFGTGTIVELIRTSRKRGR